MPLTFQALAWHTTSRSRGLGDPECQVLMLRLMSDLVPAMLACCDGQLKNFDLRWYPDAALTVVMAAKGYPGSYSKGSVIEGLDEAAKVEGVEIFHAGTAEKDGRIVTNGGRVLNVSALAPTVAEAQTRAYRAIDLIRWPERLLPPRHRLAGGRSRAGETPMTKSLGLALGGGGARGIAHIAVLEVLDEMGVVPTAVAGTSIGALIGAAYAAGMSGRDIRRHVIALAHNRGEVLRRLVARARWQFRQSVLWRLRQCDAGRRREILRPVSRRKRAGGFQRSETSR